MFWKVKGILYTLFELPSSGKVLYPDIYCVSTQVSEYDSDGVLQSSYSLIVHPRLNLIALDYCHPIPVAKTCPPPALTCKPTMEPFL